MMNDKRFQAKLAELDYKTEVRNDAISRQEVNKLQKYRYNCGDAAITCVSLKSINELPPVNPQFCDDAISRQAVIDGINEYLHDKYYQRTSIQDCRDCLIKDVIKNMPSVTPQQKMGHWIRVDKDKLKCSKCEVIHFIAQYPQGKIAWCPNCGAKMESEKEE